MSDQKRLEALLKQYEILLTYSTSTIPASKNAILAFGLGAIGAIVGGTAAILAYGKNNELCIASFLFVIPAACLCLLFIWLGEIHRMLRAGWFVANLEDRLNKEFNCVSSLGLCWEKFIRLKRNKIQYPEIFVISIFIGTSVTSIICGLSVLNYTISIDWMTPYYIIAYAVILCVVMVFGVMFLLKRMKAFILLSPAMQSELYGEETHSLLGHDEPQGDIINNGDQLDDPACKQKEHTQQ